MVDRIAVVIGINYTHFPPNLTKETATRAGMNPLQFAEADARDMATTLQSAGYAVQLLLGAAATRRAILDTLRQQVRIATEDSLVVVYFAGHGQVDPDDPNTAYLLPVDADPQNPGDQAIPLDDLAQRRLGQTRSSLLLLDCCHSGFAAGLRGSVQSVELGREFGRLAKSTFSNVRGRIVLTACAGNQLARELSQLQHGAFTYYMLDWWQTSHDVDDYSLASYVTAAMEREGLPAPVRGGVQEGRLLLRPLSSSQPSAPDLSWRQQIYKALQNLDDTHFRYLVFLLGHDYEALPGSDRVAKTQRIILDWEAAGRTSELNAAIAATIGKISAPLEIDNTSAAGLSATQDRANKSLLSGDSIKPSTSATWPRWFILRGVSIVAALLVFVVSIFAVGLILQGSFSGGTPSPVIMTQTPTSLPTNTSLPLTTTPVPLISTRIPSKVINPENIRQLVTISTAISTDHISSLAFAPNTSILATGNRDGAINLWRVPDLSLLTNLAPGRQDANVDVPGLAFSPDGRTLAAGSRDGVVRLWSFPDYTPRLTFETKSSGVQSIAFAADSHVLAVGTRDGEIQLWQVDIGAPLKTLAGPQTVIWDMVFSLDGRILASAMGERDGQVFQPDAAQRSVRLWTVLGITGSADRKGDPITPTNAASVEQFGTPLTFPDKVTSLTLTSKGEMFAAGLFSGKIGVWQLSNPADIHWLQAPLNVVNSINFSPDGQLLAAASGQGSIPVWRVSDWAPLPSLTGIAPGLGFTSVRFSPDGEILAAGAADKTIRLWRLP